MSDLAERHVGLHACADAREDVLGARCRRLQGPDGVGGGRLVAPGSHCPGALHLARLELRIDRLRRGSLLVSFIREGVEADDDHLAGLDRALDRVRRVADGIRLVALGDGGQRFPACVNGGDLGQGSLNDLVGQGLDVIRACQRVDGVRDAGLILQHLLRSQCQASRGGRRQAERLVQRVRVQRLRPAEDGGEGLDGGTHHVHVGLLRGQRRSAGLDMEAHRHAAGSLRPNRSRATCAQTRRAARNLATSSSRSL